MTNLDPDILATIPDDVLREVLKLTEAKKKVELRHAASDDFMRFVHHVYDNFIEGTHHRIFARTIERVAAGELKRVIINIPPRHALSLAEPVLTTAGWKTIGTLEAGDRVFGPDGHPTTVLGKSEVFHDRQLYVVTTDDGCEVVCDGDHVWTVRLDRHRKKFIDYTTEQLYQREQGAKVRRLRSGKVEIGPPGAVDNVRAARLPDSAAVNLPDAPLPVDPYVLGVWLGDGAKSNASITCHEDDAPHIRREIERRGYVTKDRATPHTFGIDGLRVPLRDDLGVLGAKHVPEAYLLASVGQRRDLLRGLMDTDGNVSAKGQCFFTQSVPGVIEAFRRLLWSLGIKNSMHSWTPRIGDREYRTAYRVTFYDSDAAFLPRKRARLIEARKKRFIRVRKLEGKTGPTQCIKVDREDGLFLVGHGMVVTHNSKSEIWSYLAPAWFLGKNPKLKIIQATHTGELAMRFGRKIRDLVDDPHYAEVFPETTLREDSKSRGRWETSQGGEYFSAGVGSAITGRGADLLIIDDPHSEQDALSETAFDAAYEWYTSGPRQRLQPGGAIVIIQTRWSKKDLTGRLLQRQGSDMFADEWEVIELPAILPSGNPLWPEFWKKEELLSVKASLPKQKWDAQWQQHPTTAEGAIVKEEWWKKWEKDNIPKLDYIMQSYDTAFSKKESADYSAITTWGIFRPEEDSKYNIILLDAQRGRWNFPELKAVAWDEYQYWDPDMVIIEAKASGMALIDELRARGIPALGFSPGKKRGGGGVDKVTRMHSVAPLFEAGMVWCPTNRPFSETVVDEVCSFPNGDHDDYADSTTMALLRFRQGGFVVVHEEEEEEPEEDHEVLNESEYY